MHSTIRVIQAPSNCRLPQNQPLHCTADSKELVSRVFPAAALVLSANAGTPGMMVVDVNSGVLYHKQRPEFLYRQTARVVSASARMITEAKEVAAEQTHIRGYLPGGKLPQIAVSPCGAWYHVGRSDGALWFNAINIRDIEQIGPHTIVVRFVIMKRSWKLEITHPVLKVGMMRALWRYCMAVDQQLLPHWQSVVVNLTPDAVREQRFNQSNADIFSIREELTKVSHTADANALKAHFLARTNGDMRIMGDSSIFNEDLLQMLLPDIFNYPD